MAIRTFLLLLIFMAVLVLSGCAAPTVTVDRDSFQFKGDVPPMVFSRDAFSGNLANLSEGETIVVAEADDGAGVLSQPTIASVDVVETILAKEGDPCEVAKSRCDRDGDGVWDSDCRGLFFPKCEIGDFVSFSSWYVISKDKQDAGNFWQTSERIDIAEEERQEVPLHLKMLTINRGTKTFTGGLTIHSKLPPQVEFLKINDVTKVRDQTETKAVLRGPIGFITAGLSGFIADMIDDYGDVTSDAEFTTDYAEDDKKIRAIAKNITLDPGEGINLEYTVNYAIRY